jgi:hypothetical protein
MTEMTPIERIARAMADAEGPEPWSDTDWESLKTHPGSSYPIWMGRARAALLAIREPTAEMRDALRQALPTVIQKDGPSAPYERCVNDKEADAAIAAMIDKALEE